MKEREMSKIETVHGGNTPPLPPVKYQTLNDIAYEAIKAQVANLTIPPGHQLVEQRLAAQLGISKSPIREAFRQLEKTGLVYLIPHKGCFASPLTVKEFKEALELREVLEVQCLSTGLPRYSKEDMQEIGAAQRMAEKKLGQGDKESASDFHLKVHNLIVKKGGNSLIEKAYHNLLDYTLGRYLILALGRLSLITESRADQHRRLFEAIKKRDVDLAVKTLLEHLRTISDDSTIFEAIRSYAEETRLPHPDQSGRFKNQ
jgi:DNA-binding GntR family transcriptional regulator